MTKGGVLDVSSWGAAPGSGDASPYTASAVPPSGSPPSLAASLGDDRTVKAAAVQLDRAGAWLFTFGALNFAETSFRPVTYADVLGLTREVLGVGEEELAERKFDDLFCPLLLSVQASFSVELPSYDGLSAMDGQVFDTALAYMAAAFLKPSVAESGETTGEVASVAHDTDKVTYFRRFQAAAADDTDLWLDRAWQLLSGIAGVSAALDAEPTPMFVAVGRRRATRKLLGAGRNPLYNIGLDMVTAYGFGGELYAYIANRVNGQACPP